MATELHLRSELPAAHPRGDWLCADQSCGHTDRHLAEIADHPGPNAVQIEYMGGRVRPVCVVLADAYTRVT